MAKRKVFISYHHKGEQKAVDDFVEQFSEEYEVFTDESLDRAADSEDSEYLNQVCRDAIDGASVTIVMMGKQTGCRKFVDWEIRHTLFRKHGLVGISKRGLEDSDACLPERLVDNLKKRYAKWYKYPSSPGSLKGMIDEAYAPDPAKADNSREKMKRNTSC